MKKRKWTWLGLTLLIAGLVLSLISFLLGPWSWTPYYWRLHGLTFALYLAISTLWFYLISVGIGILVFGGLLPREHEKHEPKPFAVAG